MITDRIGRHEVLLPSNHKNYNFGEKKNSQVMKERENLHLNADKKRRKHSEATGTATGDRPFARSGHMVRKTLC